MLSSLLASSHAHFKWVLEPAVLAESSFLCCAMCMPAIESYFSTVKTIVNVTRFIYFHIYPPRKRRSSVRARLGVAGHLSTTLR